MRRLSCQPMVAPFLPDEDKVAAIRAELVATGAGIYLDAASAGPLPAEADRAMREWADWELRVGRAGEDAEAEFQVRLDEARGTIAAVLVAPAEHVWLAPSAGLGIHLAAEWRRWRAGDRIVAAASLAESILAALEPLARVTLRAELEIVAATAGERSGKAMGRLAEAIGRGAALVVVPHVSALDGTVLPVAALAESAHRAGAWLAVDGSLAAGAIPVNAPSIGADIYALAGNRWLLGPSGAAAVYIGPSVAVEADSDADATSDRLGSSGGRSGSLREDFHRAAVVGLGRSAGWLAMQVGLEWAFARTHRLVERAADLLRGIAGVTVLTPTDQAAATLVFRVKDWPAERLRDELGHRVYAILGVVESADAIRASIGCWNTEAEIDRFAEVLTELAGMRPEDAVRRPPIVVLPADGS